MHKHESVCPAGHLQGSRLHQRTLQLRVNLQMMDPALRRLPVAYCSTDKKFWLQAGDQVNPISLQQ